MEVYFGQSRDTNAASKEFTIFEHSRSETSRLFYKENPSVSSSNPSCSFSAQKLRSP